MILDAKWSRNSISPVIKVRLAKSLEQVELNEPEHVRHKALCSHDYFLENFLPTILRYVVFRHHTVRLSTLVYHIMIQRGSTNLGMNYDIQ